MPLGYELLRSLGPGSFSIVPASASLVEEMMARDETPKSDGLIDPLKAGLKKRSKTRTAQSRKIAQHELRSDMVTRRNDLLPNLRLVMRPLTELLDYMRTLRPFDPGDVVEMANTISSKGFVSPVIVGRDGRTILDGELRVKAAHWLQLSEVPCIMLEHLTVAEERATRVALNRIGQRRQWDLEELKLELEELVIEEQPIDLLGFDNVELDQIMLDEEEEPGERVVTMLKAAVTQPDDLWLLGPHRVLCADALAPDSYAALMGDERAQVMLTDPPYNIAVSSIVSTAHEEFAQASGEMSDDEFSAFLLNFLTAATARLDPGAVAYVFMDWRQIDLLLLATRTLKMERLSVVAWVKSQPAMGSFYRSQHELVAVVKMPGDYNNRIQLGVNGRNRSNVWFSAGAGTGGSDAREMLGDHPTPKPVGTLVEALLDVTEPGDIVLDGFGGSGSTLIAAERCGRCARLIELAPKYCDLIVRRWEAETGEQALLERTGQSWVATAADRGVDIAADEVEDMPKDAGDDPIPKPR